MIPSKQCKFHIPLTAHQLLHSYLFSIKIITFLNCDELAKYTNIYIHTMCVHIPLHVKHPEF